MANRGLEIIKIVIDYSNILKLLKPSAIIANFCVRCDRIKWPPTLAPGPAPGPVPGPAETMPLMVLRNTFCFVSIYLPFAESLGPAPLSFHV
jgi:hypothetical protein